MTDLRDPNFKRITTLELANEFIDDSVKQLKERIKDDQVILALSGGVDSNVVAALLNKAIGKNLYCIHVNHGLLRKNESEEVLKIFKEKMNLNLIYLDVEDYFLDKLKGVSDPETKRKIIGNEFINCFVAEAKKLNGIKYLAQGTIYPDITESKGIKAHHNVGGLPSHLNFELIEPVRLLYKDEVRMIGKALGLPDELVYRQPFPGPGLAVRCPGEITKDRLNLVRETDYILRDEFNKCGLSKKVWQYFTIVPDYKSVGVKDDKRTYLNFVVIRAVNSVDATTATVEEIPYDVLFKIRDRMLNEVEGINRVLVDITPKPTGTIEWE
jgi:GMP synthase (glutamine-hydrolysing)